MIPAGARAQHVVLDEDPTTTATSTTGAIAGAAVPSSITSRTDEDTGNARGERARRGPKSTAGKIGPPCSTPSDTP